MLARSGGAGRPNSGEASTAAVLRQTRACPAPHRRRSSLRSLIRCWSHHACAASAVQASWGTVPASRFARSTAEAGRSAGSLARHCRMSASRWAGIWNWRTCAGRCRLIVDMGERRRKQRLGSEHEVPGEQIVRHAAQRVEVGAAVDLRLGERDLRRHEGGRARRDARDGQRCRRCGRRRVLDQTEVEHLDEVVVGPSRQTKMLAGLMSRWTRPRACASASEWHTCRST